MKKFSILFMSVIAFIVLTGCTEGDLNIAVDDNESIESRAEEVKEKLSNEVRAEDGDLDMEDENKTFTDEEEAYADILNSVSSVTNEFSNALVNVVNNEGTLDELEFHYTKVAVALELLNSMTEDDVVPELYKDSHEYLIGICESVTASRYLILDGIEYKNAEKFNDGVKHIEKATDFTIKLEEEYKKIIEKYSN